MQVGLQRSQIGHGFAGLDGQQIADGNIVLSAEAEIALAGALAQFCEVLNKVAERGMPHLLCTYLYELSGLFSSFYENCPVLSAEGQTLRQSRLRLAALTGRTLTYGLQLLGLTPLSRM